MIKVVDIERLYDDEDYVDTKHDSMAYNGVEITKESGFMYITMDVKKGGFKFITDKINDMKTFETNSSLDNINNVLKNNDMTCVLK